MILLISLLIGSAQADTSAIIKNISIFRNEIQLGFEKSNSVKVGTKLVARTSVNHKCLLIITRVSKDSAYADANQCPGYATLKKGQTVTTVQENEVNEEIRITVPTPLREDG